MATRLLLAAQLPPDAPSVSVIVYPAHTPVGPPIAPGAALTVNTTDELQPPANVYVMVLVPAIMLLITPVDPPIVATNVFPLLQLPPVVASLKVVSEPAHTAAVPKIEVGCGLTLTIAVAIQPDAV